MMWLVAISAKKSLMIRLDTIPACKGHNPLFYPAANLVENLSRHVEIDAAGSLVRARAIDIWNVEKTVSTHQTNLLKLDFRYVSVLIMT